MISMPSVNLDVYWDKLEGLSMPALLPGQLPTERLKCGLLSFDQHALSIFRKVCEPHKHPKLEIIEEDDHQKVVIVLFGDREINAIERGRLRSLLSLQQRLIPIIIFSDGFYKIPDYEFWGYGRQITLLEKVAEFPVLPLKTSVLKKEKRFFVSVLALVEKICCLRQMTTQLEQIQMLLRKKTAALIPESDGGHSYFEIAHYEYLIQRILNHEKQIIRTRSFIETGLGKIRNHFQETSINISKDAVVDRIKFKENAAVIKELGFDFLEMAHHLRKFFNQIKGDKVMEGGFIKKLTSCEQFLEFATDISILGVFSSGKTTFINSLLGTQLNTSSGHNTAILTSLNYIKSPKDTSSLELNYHKDLHFELLSVDNTHDELVKEAPCTGQILSLFQENNLNILTLMDEEGGMVRPLNLESRQLKNKYFIKGSTKLVRKIKVEKGEALTDGLRRETLGKQYKHLKCFNKKEIKAVAEMIQKKATSKALLILFRAEQTERITSPEKIVDFLRALYKVADLDNNNISPFNQSLLEQPPLNDIWQADLYLSLKKTHSLPNRITLDKLGWAQLRSNNERKGFMEMPECYLFIKNANMFLDRDFLKLAKIIDTPGIGSVTNRHDKIAEQKLRESEGIIIIMIPITTHTEKQEFWNLLGLLHCIFTHRKKSTDRIIFLCNWFGHLFGNNIKSGVQQIEQLKIYLAEFGFIKPSLFVCDLKAYLIEKKEPNELHGYPSIGKLKIALRQKIRQYGAGKKLQELQLEIKQLLVDQKKEDSQLLIDIEKNEEHKLQIIKDLKKQKKYIKAMEYDSKIYKAGLRKLSDASSNCSSILNRIETQDDWNNAKKRILQFARGIDLEFSKPNYFSHLASRVKDIERSGRKFSNGMELKASTHKFKQVGEFNSEALSKKINSSHNNWPRRWGRIKKWFGVNLESTLKEQRNNVLVFFNKEISRIKENYKKKSGVGEAWFENSQDDAIAEIEVKKLLLESGKGKAAKKVKNRQQYLKETINPRWKTISDQIIKITKDE